MTNQQPDFTDLNSAWNIDGDTAQRGNVILRHYQNPSCYRARVYVPELGFVEVTQFTATDALNSFRAKLAHEFLRWDKVATELADALAAIDAPEARRMAEEYEQ